MGYKLTGTLGNRRGTSPFLEWRSNEWLVSEQLTFRRKASVHTCDPAMRPAALPAMAGLDVQREDNGSCDTPARRGNTHVGVSTRRPRADPKVHSVRRVRVTQPCGTHVAHGGRRWRGVLGYLEEHLICWHGTGHVELRTRVESNETELVLVPADGSDPMWIARIP